MCFSKVKQTVIPGKTIEELIAERSVGMTDEQKAQFWYELSQSAFSLLGKVEITIYEIPANIWLKTAQAQYQFLTDVKLADDLFYVPDEIGMSDILKHDWTNLITYIPNKNDCDDFAARLYDHLVTYYGITGIIPVWGDSSAGYHAFNLAVLKNNDQSGAELPWIARLIEPQTDSIFIDQWVY